MQGDVVNLLVRFRVMSISKALLSTQDLSRCGWETVFPAGSGHAYLRKPYESQKARALWRMKAARDSGEDFHDAKTTCWEEIKRDWNCGKSTSKTDCGTGQSFEVRGDFVLNLIIGPRIVVEVVFNGLRPRTHTRRGSALYVVQH